MRVLVVLPPIGYDTFADGNFDRIYGLEVYEIPNEEREVEVMRLLLKKLGVYYGSEYPWKPAEPTVKISATAKEIEEVKREYDLSLKEYEEEYARLEKVRRFFESDGEASLEELHQWFQEYAEEPGCAPRLVWKETF